MTSIDQGKAKVNSKQITNQGTLYFVMSLPWLVIEIQDPKVCFHLNIRPSVYTHEVVLDLIKVCYITMHSFNNIDPINGM